MINNNELIKQHFEDKDVEYRKELINSCINEHDTTTYFTPNEVADYLHCSAQTVRKWIKLGKMESTKYQVGLRSFIGLTGKNISDFIDGTKYVMFIE